MKTYEEAFNTLLPKTIPTVEKRLEHFDDVFGGRYREIIDDLGENDRTYDLLFAHVHDLPYNETLALDILRRMREIFAVGVCLGIEMERVP